MIAYRITNTTSGKAYIGITCRSLRKRWVDHCSDARTGATTPLHRAIRKYGESNFVIEQIASAVDYKALLLLEMVLIQQERTFIRHGGYNVTLGGDGTLGRIPSAATLAKMRASAKKVMGNPLVRAHLSFLAKIQMNTPEAKSAVSARRKGQTTSPEARAKLSRALTGRVLPLETVEKVRQALLGKPRSEGTKAKISATRKSRQYIVSDETRRKLSEAHKGRPHQKRPRAAPVVFSAQAKANIRAGWVLRKQRGSKNGGRPRKATQHREPQVESTSMMTQKEAIETFLPRIDAEGRDYEKFAEVDARPAEAGERIVTVTSDGKETENTAKEGDIVVRNHTGAREEYILPTVKFQVRYERLEAADESGWGLYKATGRCRAFRYDDVDTEFTASWNESMRLRSGDMVCTPLPKKDEVYRIAAMEFSETYREVAVESNYDRRS